MLKKQTAVVRERSADLIGLSKAEVEEQLRRQETQARDLAAVDEAGASKLLVYARLVAEGRPEVVARWGATDGVDLHNLAIANRVFRVLPQALLEAGKQADAARWSHASADASLAVFRLSARCHDLPLLPSKLPSSLPADGRPPLPLLALDLAAEGRLVEVGADGSPMAVGPGDLRLRFTALSPDGTQIVADTVIGRETTPSVRVVGVDGQVQQEFEGAWDCGGWLADATIILGVYDGDEMRLERAGTSGEQLPIRGSCPTPGTRPDSVLMTRGRVERDDSWVAEQRQTDGATVRDIRLPDCNVTSPAASPDGKTVAVAAACVESMDSGIWTEDSSGELAHILTCVCGVPTFSPDGRWIAFATTPVEGSDGFDTRLGFARADGSGAFYLPEGQLSFPLWPGPAD